MTETERADMAERHRAALINAISPLVVPMKDAGIDITALKGIMIGISIELVDALKAALEAVKAEAPK